MPDDARLSPLESRVSELLLENQRLRDELSRIDVQAGQLRHYEEQRHIDTRRFRAVLANNRSGILLLNSAGIILEVVHGIFGFSADQLVGREVTQLMCPESVPLFQMDLQRVSETPGADACGEYRILDRAAQCRWVDCVLMDRLEDSAIQAIVMNYRDITDRKLAEARLALLASVVESSDRAVILQDFDGHILSWNRSAEQLYGYAAAETVGKDISILLPPGCPDDESIGRQRILGGAELPAYPTARLCKDGSIVGVRLKIALLLDRQQRPIGCSHTARALPQPRAEGGIAAAQAFDSRPGSETFASSGPLAS